MTGIDLDAGTLRVRDLEGGRERTRAVGRARAGGRRPPGRGGPSRRRDCPGAFTLRTIEDAQAIRAWIDEHDARSAVVIGGGYIGLEVAEAFLARGLATTVIEREDAPADARRRRRRRGDRRRAARRRAPTCAAGPPSRRSRATSGCGACVAGGRGVDADVVVIGIGVRPDTALAAAAGLALGPHGGVVVDAGMRTGIDGVWAAGDCCQTRHLLHDGPAYVPLGTTANKQGRVAGTTLTGGDAAFGGVLGHGGREGVRAAGRAHRARRGARRRPPASTPSTASITHISRARYYPGHEPLQVKLVAERGSGRLLGGQLVGREGVAKRVDVVAAALHAGATADELARLRPDLRAAVRARCWDPLPARRARGRGGGGVSAGCARSSSRARVAVVGASDEPGKVGTTLMRNLDGFEGEVVPISSRREEVAGRPRVQAAARRARRRRPRRSPRCRRRPCPASSRTPPRPAPARVVVLSGGFAETGAGGRRAAGARRRGGARRRRADRRAELPRRAELRHRAERVDGRRHAGRRRRRSRSRRSPAPTGWPSTCSGSSSGWASRRSTPPATRPTSRDAEVLRYLGADDATRVVCFFVESLVGRARLRRRRRATSPRASRCSSRRRAARRPARARRCRTPPRSPATRRSGARRSSRRAPSSPTAGWR